MCNGESIGLLGGINARRSCRAFKSTPLSPALLKSVFEYATLSPSAKNAQPWEVYVVSGEKLDALRQTMLADLKAGRTAPMSGSADTDARRARARELSEEMTPYIQRQGWEGSSFVERSIRFFDAPAAAIVCLDEPAGDFHALDVGMFVQTLCLSATGHGLGSCILGYPRICEPAIREFLHLPPGRRVMVGVALGFPDMEQPMAQFESNRAELDENVHFVFE